MLRPNMPMIDDTEGAAVPAGLPPVIDTHVHIFPHTLFPAVWKWFDENAYPTIIHAGREPSSAAYRCDPYTLCSAERLASVVGEYPTVKFCVPHLGMDETSAYRKLIERYDNLWLDTAMALSTYLRGEGNIDLARYRPDRIMYGSDFPNIPFAWDRELKKLAGGALDADRRERILHRNATAFFDWPSVPTATL